MAEQRRPVAVVTGGRQGLGRGAALALAGRGFDLVLVDLHRDAVAEETLAEVQRLGAGARFVRGDVADLDRHAQVAAALRGMAPLSYPMAAGPFRFGEGATDAPMHATKVVRLDAGKWTVVTPGWFERPAAN